jgi:hypothetical protein
MVKTTSILLLAAAFILSGCATKSPSQRISADQAVFDGWSAEVQTAIQSGEIAVGFTTEQVLMAWGEPDERTTEVSAEADVERWIYLKSSPAFSIGIGGGSYGSNVGIGTSVGTTIGGDTRITGLVRFINDQVISFDQRKK